MWKKRLRDGERLCVMEGFAGLEQRRKTIGSYKIFGSVCKDQPEW